ncbi:MAG: GNAT family N-acetyltransferase [Pseudomonadota bacterium]|nr:GNAT family N-acetyltransferase [Pseudomonadota bacterium]
MILETDRLVLRPFEESDLPAVAQLRADRTAMDHLARTTSPADPAAWLARLMAEFAADGIGYMPIVRKEGGELIGYAGLRMVDYDLAFAPATDIGWVLSSDHWGHGYATEAAARWLRYGFEELDRERIIAHTAVGNHPSQAVMRRLGMRRVPAFDFDHPNVPEDRPELRPQFVFELTRDAWHAGSR